MRNPANAGRDTAELPTRLRLQPIAEYLRHVSRAGDDDRRDVVLSIPRKLYRVSEIAHHLDITRQTVHNYATIGIITEEARTPGGQRLFDESVFPRLFRIHRLKRTHRLHEIRRILDEQERRGPHADDVAHASDMADVSGSADHDPQMKDTRRLDA
jgi:DNA-binding transcriptional MerR regulator